MGRRIKPIIGASKRALSAASGAAAASAAKRAKQASQSRAANVPSRDFDDDDFEDITGWQDDDQSVLDLDVVGLDQRLSELEKGDDLDGEAAVPDLSLSHIQELRQIADYLDRHDEEDTGPEAPIDVDDESAQPSREASPLPQEANDPSPTTASGQMLPPSRSNTADLFPADTSTALPQRQRGEISDTELAVALWCETSGVSRAEYKNLRDIYQMLNPTHEQLSSLPTSLDTVKSHLQGALPLLQLRQKEVGLDVDVLPTAGTAPTKADTLHFFDPASLFNAMLSSTELTGKMFTGLGHFIDSPSEPWHSRAWLSSIRSTSGQFAIYPVDDRSAAVSESPHQTRRSAADAEGNKRIGQPIFPSDFVRYQCLVIECACHSSIDDRHLGVVTAAGLDHRTVRPHGGPLGSKAVRIQRLAPATELPVQLRSGLDPTAHHKELFLFEHVVDDVLEPAVQPYGHHISLHYQYGAPANLQLPTTPTPSDLAMCRFFIRRIFNSRLSNRSRLRPLMQSHPIRGQLEIETYGRTFLLQKMAVPGSNRAVSMPLFTFIDGFGLYRNMYRALMGFYFVNASLNHVERARRANVTPLTLGPHGSSMGDVVDALGPRISQFEAGNTITLHTGETVTVFAFTFAFTGDMVQQQKNSGFMSFKAIYGCRHCFITKEERGKLDFDIVDSGRYHHQTMAMRKQLNSLGTNAARQRYSKATGLDPSPDVPLHRLSPALDILLSRPSDAAHSEFGGITELAHGLLLENILTPTAAREYCGVLRHFPFPPGWAHLQNPGRYLGSYRLSEHGRWSIVAPVLLRVWLRDSHIKPLYAEAVREVRML